MRISGNTECWSCNGVATNGPGGGDHNLFMRNWGLEEVVLCPKLENELTPISLCASMYREGHQTNRTGDHNGVCDPTVIKVGSTYYMYYTADPWDGANNQMFLATSTDGRAWTKYPNNSVPATPVIPFTPTDRYGIGEGSAVYKDGLFYLYYTDLPWYSTNTVRRASSWDGVNFSTGTQILGTATIPWGNEGTGGVDVRYIPGWNVWFMVSPTHSKQHLTWNISRDGIHWLPWDGAFGHETRLIQLPRRFATAPALEADQYGHFGNGQLTSTQSTRVYFSSGDSQYIRGCADARSYDGENCLGGYDNPQPPDEPAGFWQWTIDAADITIATEPLYGYLDAVTSDKFAYGWAYDKDTGTNDAASNGSATGPLGHYTAIRAIAISTTTGQRYEGPWHTAEIQRSDLVTAGAAPDPYHGFWIDLKTQGFPSGTYLIRIEGGEFPTGMGARELNGEFTVSLP